jgi:hypothetical protein
MQQSWLHPSAQVRPAGRKGLGIFATALIPAGTTVCGFGGNVVERAEFDLLDEDLRTHSIQMDDDLFLVSVPPYAPADYINHACEPNCGIIGTSLVVTTRDVAGGDELCFDYAMSDTNDYDEFLCACELPSCRRLVTGGDWKLPELQERYRGFFSSYIERKIAVAVDDS